MLRNKIAILVFCSSGFLAFADDPICHYDLRQVDLERSLTFCPMDYADDGVCCTEREEAALEETFTSASVDLTTECADYYKQVRFKELQH